MTPSLGRNLLEYWQRQLDRGSGLSLKDQRQLSAEILRLHNLINKPEIKDFVAGVEREMAHQIERWGEGHDKGKHWAEWLALFSYLEGKLTDAIYRGDHGKVLHHLITLAAAAGHAHRHLKTQIESVEIATNEAGGEAVS